jgi:predicted dehydrogenase
VKAIRKKSNPTSTPDEAYKLMRIIDAVYLSAKTNKPVLLSKKKEQSR